MMKMHSLLALLLTVQCAFATSFYIRPFSEFTKTTPNIIRGKLNNIRVENGRLPDGGATIFTFASLDIKEVIKGNITGTQIQIRKLGGSKDGITLEIPSSVEFTEKEEGVYFLSDELEDHSYEVSSLELGKFTLVQKNGNEVLEGGIFAYSKPKPGHEHDVHADDISENLKPWSVEDLKELVKNQQATQPAPSSETQKTSEISNTSINDSTPSSTTTNTQLNNNSIISEEKNDSPLYFSPTLWYSLATIILTLSVIWFFRKG